MAMVDEVADASDAETRSRDNTPTATKIGTEEDLTTTNAVLQEGKYEASDTFPFCKHSLLFSL